jgi:hypothetical protein
MKVFTFMLCCFGLQLSLEAQNSMPSIIKINDEDIWAKTLVGSHFTESWTYQCYFDNGTSLYAVFTVSNLGVLKPAVSGLQLSLYNFKGNDYQISREYPLKHLLQDSSDYSFNINPRQGNIWFKGKLPEQHELYINTNKDGDRFKINLNFTDIAKAIEIESPIFSNIEHESGFIAHIPYAEISGYVGIDDDTIAVKGKAYMDHSWLTGKTSDHFKAIYRYVSQVSYDSWSFIYALFPTSSEYRATEVIGFNVHKLGGETIFNELRATENSGKEIHKMGPTSPEVVLLLPLGDSIRICNKQQIGSYAMLEDVGWLARKALKRIAGGEVIYYRGKAEMSFGAKSYPWKLSYYNYLLIK